MKPQLIAALAAVVATFAAPTLSATAQTQATSIVQQFDTTAALGVPSSLDLSLRSHDDWALPALGAPALDLSPRSHDDWAVQSAF